MPSYTIYANANDYSIRSQSGSWSFAREGTDYKDTPGGDIAGSLRPYSIYEGTEGYFDCHQALMSFDTSGVAGEIEAVAFHATIAAQSGATEQYDLSEKSWSGTNVANFTPGSQIGALTRFNEVPASIAGSTGTPISIGKASLTLPRQSSYGLMMSATRQRTNSQPNFFNFIELYSGNDSARKPYLSIVTNDAIEATATAILDPVLGTSEAATVIAGTATATLDPVIGSGEAELSIAGTATATLAPVVATGEAELLIAASATATLDPVIGTAEAYYEDGGLYGFAILAPVIGASAAALLIEGEGLAILDPVLGSSAAELHILGEGVALLAPLLATGDIAVIVEGDGIALLDPALGYGDIKVIIAGEATMILAPVIGSGKVLQIVAAVTPFGRTVIIREAMNAAIIAENTNVVTIAE